MIYLIIILILIALTYVYDYKGITRGRILWILIILLTFIGVAGLRYRIGIDSIRYERFFEEIPDIMGLTGKDFEKSRFAPLYIVFCSLIKSFTDKFYVFQIIHAIIINSIIFYFFYKNTKHFFLAIIFYFLILYFDFNTEILRESLAVCVFLLASPSFYRRKWILWYSFSVIAFLFHVSGGIMFLLPLCLLPGIRSFFVIGKRTVLLCVGLFILSIIIQKIFFKYIEAFAVFESLADRASTYSKSDTGSGLTLNIKGYLSYIIMIAYPLFAIWAINKRKNKDVIQEEKNIDAAFFAIMGIYITGMTIGIFILGRFNNYFQPFIFIEMAEFFFGYIPVMKKKVKLNFIYWIILLLPYLGLRVYGNFYHKVNTSGSLKKYMVIYPYTSILDPEKDKNREKVFQFYGAH